MDIRNALLTKLHNSSFNELKGIIDEGIAHFEMKIKRMQRLSLMVSS